MSDKLPTDTSIEAEYEDGFILSETEHDDVNPFNGEGNTFTAVLQKLPEADHGRMIRFSCFWKNQMHTIDWTTLPDNARPIRFRHGYNTLYEDGTVESGFMGVDFGVQWNDEQGKNYKEISELR